MKCSGDAARFLFPISFCPFRSWIFAIIVCSLASDNLNDAIMCNVHYEQVINLQIESIDRF